ncbi:MAG: serine protein kinase RIO [Candidatus ainarchaeum sp.]|nr:serine protein kinase RIO [Candidatus ainarchaeum sp.]
MGTPGTSGKRPDKYIHQLKERAKVESDVFDRRTLLHVSKLIKKRILANLDYPVSTGKESIVFKATAPSGAALAVKIYKITTSIFSRKGDYIKGDPRFEKIKWNEKDVVYAFAKKEFKNLELCEQAGVRAPTPIILEGNAVVMGFLGGEKLPYPKLIQTICEERQLNMVLEDVKKLYAAGLVHADLSEYNILVANDGTTYMIDWGQGVPLAHPKALEFLERDVRNVLSYFKKFGVGMDFEEALAYVKSK